MLVWVSASAAQVNAKNRILMRTSLAGERDGERDGDGKRDGAAAGAGEGHIKKHLKRRLSPKCSSSIQFRFRLLGLPCLFCWFRCSSGFLCLFLFLHLCSDKLLTFCSIGKLILLLLLLSCAWDLCESSLLLNWFFIAVYFNSPVFLLCS